MTDAERYRNALMWAFDRLSIDDGMTLREQKRTMQEIGKVLCGRPSRASSYTPDEWGPSHKLNSKTEAAQSAE